MLTSGMPFIKYLTLFHLTVCNGQVRCDDLELEKRIEEKITEFCTLMERKPSEAAQVGQALTNVAAGSFMNSG
jgi:hypothetical protein